MKEHHRTASRDTGTKRMRWHNRAESTESTQLTESSYDRPTTAGSSGMLQKAWLLLYQDSRYSCIFFISYQACESDYSVKIIILRGEGRAFCAGGDVVGRLILVIGEGHACISHANLLMQTWRQQRGIRRRDTSLSISSKANTRQTGILLT